MITNKTRVEDGWVSVIRDKDDIVLEINPDIVGPMRVRMSPLFAHAIGEQLQKMAETRDDH